MTPDFLGLVLFAISIASVITLVYALSASMLPSDSEQREIEAQRKRLALRQGGRHR